MPQPVLRILALCLTLFWTHTALAQSADSLRREIALSIPEQSLQVSVKALAAAFDKQFILESTEYATQQAPSLEGRFTETEALDRLLATSALTYRYVNSRTLAIVAAQAPAGSSAISDTSTNSPTRPKYIEEIVVTVQKRDQSVLDVPASVSVFDAEALERYNLRSVRDLSRLTPNFLGSSFTNTQPIFSIRGGSNTLSAIGTNEPVGVFIDEVFIPRFSGADLELFDLEQAEVLRGPQGTFFGRNVAAGAVILTSTEPSLDEFSAKTEIGLGNLSEESFRGLINGPLTESLAGKFSVGRTTHDGFGEDRLTGREQDDRDSLTLRGALKWQAGEHLEFRLSSDYSKDNNGGRTLSSTTFGDDGDGRTSELGVPQSFDREIFGVNLLTTYDLPSGSLLSITALRKSASDERFSFNGLNFSLLPFAFQQVDRDREEPESFSQELRWVSDLEGPISLIGGVYYLQESADRIVDRQRLLAGAGITIADLTFDQSVDTEVLAGYLDGTWLIGDRLTIAAGLRYTYEDREADLRYTDRGTPANSFSAIGLEQSFDAFTPRLSISYALTDSTTSYLSVSRGFTAGGFNTEADSLAEIIEPFDEESITSFEVGLKSAFQRGFLYLTAFRQNYEDKQEFVFNRDTFFGTILNAAEATIEGVEIEAGFRVADGLELSANYGYLDAQYDRFPIDSANSNSGNTLGSSPEHSFAATADWMKPIAGGNLEVFVNLSYSWVDDYFTGASNDPDLSVESFELLGGTLGLRSSDERWVVELWGSNLLDEEFVLIPSNFIVQAEYLGAPRRYGLRFRYDFL